MQDLIILSHDAYTDLRQSLKEIDVDLCYSAASARPLRMRWTPERVHDKGFRQAIEERRPANASFRIVSVEVTKPGNRLWPDQLAVTFHAVSERQEAALQTYLTAHRIGMPQLQPVATASESEDNPSKTYIQIALLLAALTALEVAAFYLPDSLQPPGWMLLIVLVLLSVVKFGLVASYFMHLRYDHRIYASCFAAGLVVATGTIFALVALFRDPSTLMIATADARPPPDTTTGHQPTAGAISARQHGCRSACIWEIWLRRMPPGHLAARCPWQHRPCLGRPGPARRPAGARDEFRRLYSPIDRRPRGVCGQRLSQTDAQPADRD